MKRPARGRPPTDAAREIVTDIAPLAPERRALLDALDHVLAEDVTSPIDLPAWTNSAMDGYAVRSGDLTGSGTDNAPIELTIVETIPAGTFPTRTIGAGECSRIFTGAPLPEGADGVIRQEDTTPLEGRVRIDDTRDAGRNFRRRGEDIQRGTVVLGAGDLLGPAQLGVLASIARAEVDVHRAPRVAFLGSGDEIAELDQREAILAGQKTASSNSYTLAAMIRRAGGVPLNLGIARDDPDDIARRLEGAREADLLVTTAGISVGEHDYLRAVLERLGGRLGFWRIRMRPGAPVGFGELFGKPWLGLPGNPVSTMVTFELFVRPTIRRLRGLRDLFRRTVVVTVTERITLGPPLTHFLRAVVEPRDGALRARLTGPQGSGILTSMVKANALVIVPAETNVVEPGERLRAIVLDDPMHLELPDWENET